MKAGGRFLLTLLCAAFAVFPAAAGANALSELRGLKTKESRIPIYGKSRLQLLIYSAECFQKGHLLEMVAPVLDIIRADADIDTIDTGKNTRVYPLGAPFAEVLKFWSGHLFSDGVVITPRADIDQEHQLAAGGDKVHFRSPILDLDGIGFEADYGRRTIFVRRDVRVVLRTAASDPLKFVKTGKLPENYEYLRGTADTLHIDMVKRLITLAGNVRVLEDRGTVDCERMLIVLPPENAKRKAQDQDDDLGIKGVANVICEGNVRVVRTGSREPQQAFADRMDYDLQKGRLRLTGKGNALPVLRQGQNLLVGRQIDILRNEERMEVLRDCKLFYSQKEAKTGKVTPVQAFADRMDFDNRKNWGVMKGNVRIVDARYTMYCGRMDIRLTESGAADKKQQAAVSNLTGMPDFAPGGKKELKNMHCSGGVKMIRAATADSPEERATAREADLVYPQEIITLTGDRPTIARGQDTLSGDRIVIDLKQERLIAAPKSRIVFHGGDGKKGSAGAKKAAAALQKTVVTSDRADLGYGSNLLAFSGNVQVRDPRMALDCRKMDIYLKDAPDAGAKKKKVQSGNVSMASLAGPDGRKVLDKIICTGSVKAREPRMKLDCSTLTLLFRQVDGKKGDASGMFQSRGTELVQVLPEGNVVLENIPEKKAAANAGKEDSAKTAGMPSFRGDQPIRMTADRGKVDLPRNISEFHGNVKVREAQGQLDCEDLYLYGKDVQPGTAGAATPESRVAALDALDDDPYADKPGVSQVPQVISIGDSKTLERVVALKKVVLVRKLPSGGEQRATGNKAEYFVNRRLVELTGEPPEYAQVVDANPQNNGKGRKITVFLDRESVAFDGRVQMEFDARNGSPAGLK